MLTAAKTHTDNNMGYAVFHKNFVCLFDRGYLKPDLFLWLINDLKIFDMRPER